MSEFELICQSESDTSRLGIALGESLEPGTVLALNGTLGAGKTRLTQAIGTGLGIVDGQVVSPTFTLCVPHEGRLTLLHLDAYRINQPEEVDELGLDEHTENGAVLIVEWAERIDNLLPPIDVTVTIEPTAETSRQFHFQPHTDKGRALLDKVKMSLPAIHRSEEA